MTPTRALLALRWTVWRRRYVSPFEAVVLTVVCGLTWSVGRSAAGATDDVAWPAAGLTVGLALLAAVAATVARRALVAGREVGLLVAQGLPARVVVSVRALELTAIAAAGLAPLVAAAVGLTGSERAAGGSAAVAALAFPALAPAIVAAAIAVGCASSRVRRAGGVALLLAAAAGAVVAVAAPSAARAAAHALGGPASPGRAILELAAGAPGSGVAFAWLVGGAVALAGAVRWARGRLGSGLDEPRGGRLRSGGARRWTRHVLRPLGSQSAALLQRDLALLARGAFPRGVALLGLLPLPLGVIAVAASDPTLRDWHLELVALLVLGVLSSGAGFLFGVDFPRARQGTLLLERTQPLRGAAVHRSRWLPAAGYGLLLTAGAAALVARAPDPALAARAGAVALEGALLALVLTHHAVAYGMRTETQADPREVAAYPITAAVMVIVFALGLLANPAFAVVYLFARGFFRSALRRWEVAEVEAAHGGAA